MSAQAMQPEYSMIGVVAERPFRITGIDRSDYMANDPARAIAFYRDVLGLELQGLAPDGGGEFELADGSTFGLWVGTTGLPFQPSNGVLFAVDDLDVCVSSLEARGIAVIDRSETSFCRMALIHASSRCTSGSAPRYPAIPNPILNLTCALVANVTLFQSRVGFAGSGDRARWPEPPDAG